MDDDLKVGSELGDTKLPLAMAHQQVEVFELLHGLSTKEKHFHKWYQGAIDTINSQNPDRIAQAAHSLRELCDELPNVIAEIPKFVNPISVAKTLGPHFLDVKKQFYDGGWEGAIISPALDEVLCRFVTIFSEPARNKRFGRALTAADPQADNLSKDWRKDRDGVFESLYGFFQNVAHHNRLATEAELIEKLKVFETLLLNYLTPCTATQQKELLELMAGPANSEAFKRVNTLILHKAANLAFFFDKLENPEWLPVLDQNGLFTNLPGPEPTGDGRIMYRHHLPLVALTRLAGKAPRTVTDIFAKLRLPNNPYVGDQILQGMARIRDIKCIQQLSPLIAQFAENSTRTTWLGIQELLKSWIELKVFSEIFAILGAYLSSTIDKSFEQPHGVSGTWLAKQIDEQCLQNLTDENPLEVAKMVFQALCKWVKREREKYNKSEIGDDAPFSYFVEDFRSPPLEYRGVEATLAKRLFSAAEQIYRRGNLSAIDQLDQLLCSNPWQLFRRLRWQLYADFPTLTLKSARAEVLQRIPFLNEIDYSRGAHDYEFAQLLVAHVKHHGDAFLSSDEIKEFANVVLKGPVDKDGKLLEGDNDFFYRKQLWPISPLLRADQLVAYRNLVPDDSIIRTEGFKPYSSGGVSGGSVVSVAPREVEAFCSMTDEELWDFLNKWKPKSGFHRDSEGKLYQENVFAVAEKFTDFVEKIPQRFNPTNKWWEKINREEILNKFLDKAADRPSKQHDDGKISASPPSYNEWSNWFGISQWIMTQSWSRQAVSRFLRNASKSDYAVPDQCLLEIPDLLRRLIEESDTALSASRNGFGDWFTTAINSVRGQAVEALLNLASRQKNAGKKVEPWIFDLIRSRLALPDESPAIFAFIGANLRLLVHLFGSELTNSSNLLFPSNRPEHRSAAIAAHFKYDQPWNMIIETFPNFVSDALDVMQAMQMQEKSNESSQNHRDFGSRLGTHIACYYWSGSFAIESEGEAALDRFFDVACRSTRAALVGQIAWIWEKHPNEPSDGKSISRVLRIWERRYAQIEKRLKISSGSSEYDSELAESIDWLSCECFPFEWRIKHTSLALERLKKAPQAYGILKAIADFSTMPNRLESMLKLLRLLLKRPSDELRWSIQFKDLAPVISIGLASDNPNAGKLAEECKDLLLRMGFSDFLNLESNGK